MTDSDLVRYKDYRPPEARLYVHREWYSYLASKLEIELHGSHTDSPRDKKQCSACNSRFNFLFNKRLNCKDCGVSLCRACVLWDAGTRCWMCLSCQTKRDYRERAGDSFYCRSRFRTLKGCSNRRKAESDSENDSGYGASGTLGDGMHSLTSPGSIASGIDDEANRFSLDSTEVDPTTAEVRDHIESLVEGLVGGSLDTASITRLYNHLEYDQMFTNYKTQLTEILAQLAYSLHMAINNAPLPADDIPTTVHAMLKNILVEILKDAKMLPDLAEFQASPPNSSRSEEQFLSAQTYEDILAVAILNKVVEQTQENTYGPLDPPMKSMTSESDLYGQTDEERRPTKLKTAKRRANSSNKPAVMVMLSSDDTDVEDEFVWTEQPLEYMVEEQIEEVTTYKADGDEADDTMNKKPDSQLSYLYSSLDFMDSPKVSFPEWGRDLSNAETNRKSKVQRLTERSKQVRMEKLLKLDRHHRRKQSLQLLDSFFSEGAKKGTNSNSESDKLKLALGVTTQLQSYMGGMNTKSNNKLNDQLSSLKTILLSICNETDSSEGSIVSSDEIEEDSLIRKAKSVDSWEDNWLFQKKRLKHNQGGILGADPVPMLVPNPEEDVRVMIGDRDMEELSDLSESSYKSIEAFSDEEEPSTLVEAISPNVPPPQGFWPKDITNEFAQKDVEYTEHIEEVDKLALNGTLKTDPSTKAVPKSKPPTEHPSFLPNSERSKKPAKDPGFVNLPPEALSIHTHAGRAVRLICKVRGTQPLATWWYRGEEPLFQDDRIVILKNGSEHQLHLYDTETRDSTTYTCMVSNCKGQAWQDFKIYFKPSTRAEHIPEFVNELSDVSAELNRCARFECTISGYPEPQVQFYKKQQQLLPGDNCSIEFLGHGMWVVLLKHLRQEDFGQYHVVAKNKLGEVSGEAELILTELEPVENIKTMRIIQQTSEEAPVTNGHDAVKSEQNVKKSSKKSKNSEELKDIKALKFPERRYSSGDVPSQLTTAPRPGIDSTSLHESPAPGTIAEREHRKWQEEAIKLEHNPYSAENLKKRMKMGRATSYQSLISRSSDFDDSFAEFDSETDSAEQVNGDSKINCGPRNVDPDKYRRDYYVNRTPERKSKKWATTNKTPNHSSDTTEAPTPEPKVSLPGDYEAELLVRSSPLRACHKAKTSSRHFQLNPLYEGDDSEEDDLSKRRNSLQVPETDSKHDSLGSVTGFESGYGSSVESVYVARDSSKVRSNVVEDIFTSLSSLKGGSLRRHSDSRKDRNPFGGSMRMKGRTRDAILW